MPWAKLDDGFTDHPKVMAAGPLAGWLFVCGLTYAARLLTDGFIPETQVRKLADLDDATGLAMRLVQVGLWQRVDGGFLIHDYLDYNPSAEKVRAERKTAQERMHRHRAGEVRANNGRSSGEVREMFSNPVPVPVPVSPVRNPEPDPSEHGADAPVVAEPDEKKPAARRRRISDEWEITDALRAYAVKWGIPDEDVDELADEFKLYWQSDGRPKANWDQAFQGRVRDVAHRYVERARRGGGSYRVAPVNEPEPSLEEKARLRAIWQAAQAEQTETAEERWARLHPDQASGLRILKS